MGHLALGGAFNLLGSSHLEAVRVPLKRALLQLRITFKGAPHDSGCRRTGLIPHGLSAQGLVCNYTPPSQGPPGQLELEVVSLAARYDCKHACIRIVKPVLERGG